MYNVAAVNKVFYEYRQKRDRAIEASEKKRAELHQKIPSLVAIDKELENTAFTLFSACCKAAPDERQATIDSIQARAEELHAEREKLLTANGFSPDYDSPVFECKLCNDTGYIGLKRCDCVSKALNRESYLSSGLGKALYEQTFETFKLEYYPGAKTEQGKTQREVMTANLNVCNRFADEFGTIKSNLVMLGGTGLGKTHLSSAIAQRVIGKGYSVIYDSAQNIFDRYQAKRFGKETDVNTEIYEQCDLLIIDDLGAEYVTSFSVSCLYNLINYRTINQLPMILNTNLSPDEIKKTYKERIFSRIIGDFKILMFYGKDIRMLKIGH